MNALLAEKVMPQQGFAPQVKREASGKPERQPSSSNLESYLRLWEQHITQAQRNQYKLCEMSVTLHRRARGLTLSDMCGRFGVMPATNGRWLDWDIDEDGDIHPINIVGPAINTNQNACLQSNSLTEIRSANQSAKYQQIAMRWQRVADYFERAGWSEAERAFVFDAVQKDGTILIRSYKEQKDSQTVHEVREKKLGLAMYECAECQNIGLRTVEDMDEGIHDVECEQCKKPAPGVVSHIAGFEAKETDVPTYEIKHELIPFFNFTIDTANAKIKGIQGAKWLQIQRLVDRVDLETKYPGVGFEGGPSNWSYPTRCDYALSSGSWDYLNRADAGSSEPDFQKFEERKIYLHAEAYANWVSPEDYVFTNGRGETTFSIKVGQTIEEAWESQYGYRPNGFVFVWIDQRLVDICSPETECLNFRESFSDVHWRRDSGSYLSSPYYSIVTIQDDITQLNTMRHNIIARNAFNPVFYDNQIFSKADFAGEYVGSKNAHLLGEDRDLTRSVFQLPVPTPSPELTNQLMFMWSIKDDVSNVTPAMRGEAQKGETFGAQRQQLEQSYGSLTSVLKSFAQCKNDTFRQKAKMAQECWTIEQFQAIGSEFGEVWNEEEVEEMCDADLDSDLIVSYKTGSEMPQSNLDREVKFAQALTALMPFIELGVVPPDKIQKILEKIDEMGQLDFDLTGLEINEVLAQKRYIDLANMCAKAGPISFDQIQALKQGVIAIDEMGQPISQLDVITEQIFAQSQISFSQWEDLDQQATFLVEQMRRELGKTETDYLLVEMLHVVLEAIKQAQQQMQMEAMMSDPAVQQQLAAESAAGADAEAAKGAEDEKAAADREEKDKERQMQAEQTQQAQALDLVKTAAQQEHEIELAKMQKEDKPKEK